MQLCGQILAECVQGVFRFGLILGISLNFNKMNILALVRSWIGWGWGQIRICICIHKFSVFVFVFETMKMKYLYLYLNTIFGVFDQIQTNTITLISATNFKSV